MTPTQHLAARIAAHLAEHRAIAFDCAGHGWTRITSFTDDGRDIIFNGTDRFQVHGDPALDRFGLMWWTPNATSCEACGATGAGFFHGVSFCARCAAAEKRDAFQMGEDVG